MRAAEETAVASRYDREVVGLSTVAAAANAYFQVLAAQDRLRVASDNLASANRVLNLIQQRLQAGTASELDTAQQESLRQYPARRHPAARTDAAAKSQSRSRVLMARSPESVRVRGGTLRSASPFRA